MNQQLSPSDLADICAAMAGLAQRQLEDHLAQLDTPIALCFDECHRLNDTTLTALKNFYELGSGGFERYLGLVLFGQPQFRERLKLPRFREIAERLVVHDLPPFSAEDTANYLTHCLTRGLPARPAAPGPDPAPGASAFSNEGAPTSIGPKSKVPCPGSALQSSPLYEGGVTAAPAGGVVLSEGGKFVAADKRGIDFGPETSDLGLIFSPDAVDAIAARASAPLAIANLAAAALVEAYKKGEQTVTARFVPGATGPKTLRI